MPCAVRVKLAYGIAAVAQVASSFCCLVKDGAGEDEREDDWESSAKRKPGHELTRYEYPAVSTDWMLGRVLQSNRRP